MAHIGNLCHFFIVATKKIVPCVSVDIFTIAVVRSRHENYRPGIVNLTTWGQNKSSIFHYQLSLGTGNLFPFEI